MLHFKVTESNAKTVQICLQEKLNICHCYELTTNRRRFYGLTSFLSTRSIHVYNPVLLRHNWKVNGKIQDQNSAEEFLCTHESVRICVEPEIWSMISCFEEELMNEGHKRPSIKHFIIQMCCKTSDNSSAIWEAAFGPGCFTSYVLDLNTRPV